MKAIIVQTPANARVISSDGLPVIDAALFGSPVGTVNGAVFPPVAWVPVPPVAWVPPEAWDTPVLADVDAAVTAEPVAEPVAEPEAEPEAA